MLWCRNLIEERRDGRTTLERADRGRAGVQPVARAPCGARHPSLDRDGIRLQRVLASAQQGHRDYPPGAMPGGYGLLPATVHHYLRLEDQHAGVDVHPVL